MASRWVNLLVDAARAVVASSRPRASRTPGGPSGTPGASRAPGARTPGASHETGAAGGYPGDYRGRVRAQYDPHPDGNPDPGEIVWTWVPYEEDHRQGKDRPVLLVGRDGQWLLALQLTSKDHDRDVQQEARAGRYWMDIGTGPWDKQGRPSEIRLNRVIRVAPQAVRREGAVMSKALFAQVTAAMAKALG
ncbi:type II toxin-antitoxin system PemK/MazF family toxin [Xylanimonas protaetiae]|uniref:Type II toxin-antitoxin system PemK/MazF family toxin n=1 Tax=Xylanimonas protaetiae TaxID=2509457 RepID=A0A4P6FB34_9MICO|nr:type II toxin-antitoxin system PemK/MazF family toxin [Xylanimonas protaetiae]QAY71499.1 type II toxin-antitoxin system PemK/MazF family toxin [Xylanimonas protaetiae]